MGLHLSLPSYDKRLSFREWSSLMHYLDFKFWPEVLFIGTGDFTENAIPLQCLKKCSDLCYRSVHVLKTLKSHGLNAVDPLGLPVLEF